MRPPLNQFDPRSQKRLKQIIALQTTANNNDNNKDDDNDNTNNNNNNNDNDNNSQQAPHFSKDKVKRFGFACACSQFHLKV
eukprot:1024296-Amphidinium_carterae.1